MFAAGRQYNHLPGYFPGSDVALNKFRISAYIALGEAADALGLGPYEVLASDLVYALARGLGTFTFGAPRTAQLKGLDGSFDLHPVLS